MIDLETLDPLVYDIDTLKLDIENGYSITEDALPAYEKRNVVMASIENGQFTQAKEQAKQFDLEYVEVYREFMEARFNIEHLA